MSYIILNGVRSSLIKGLLIQSLPPISKPLIRTQVETVDGRDGDIVTKLGYSAYDKTMTIGLFGDFDIDQVIEYFNSEGTVIFSNEPGKYYQYQILEQIDFEKLLRFKTATVTFHVQPFKYSAVDDVVLLEAEMIHLKTFSATKNGVTATVSNGALTIQGTATEPTEFFVPIDEVLIEPRTWDTGYYASFSGGETSGSNYGTFLFGFTEEANLDYEIPDLRTQLSSGQDISYSGILFNTSRIWRYLWVKVESGESLKIAPSLSIKDSIFGSNLIYINAGNIESRPVITISTRGSMTAKISLNGVEVLTVAFTGTDQITLDCENLNAYTGNTLRNRNITGDLSKIRLKMGKNEIVVAQVETGEKMLDSVRVEKESRWI